MDKERRVAVTGLGAITPLGNSVSETWEALKAGKNGIGEITAFDTEKFKAKLADIVNAQRNIIESAINGDIDNENSISDKINELIDAGNGEKLENWNGVILRRPDPQAIWPVENIDEIWKNPDGFYHRSSQGGGCYLGC